MKTRFLIIFAIATTGFFVTSEIFAEPVSYEEFMKDYQPKLDRVQEENLSPMKQSEIGILFNDIFCHDNKIHVLKLTGENYIACVTPESAQRLVERGWGLMHRDDPHKGTAGAECTNWWMVHHEGDNIPLKSSLIKTIRLTTDEFANEFVVWDPVRFVENKNNILVLSSHGAFADSYLNRIIGNLLDVENVMDVEFKQRGCI